MPKIDSRFLVASGPEVFNGNELLIKGCLETEGGVSLYTGYPGSPVAGFFDTLSSLAPLLREKGVRAFQANNEALACAALNGSQMLPMQSIAAMKSVGLHVASDALALANLAGPNPGGGAVVITGDDPWCESTQVPADSRFLLEHLRMPVVEPGDIQQLKDWINLSFKLSRASRLYVGYVVTPATADGGGTVQCHENRFPQITTRNRTELDTSKLPISDTVLLPPRTWMKELEIPARFALAIKSARELGINRILNVGVGQGPLPVGFIVTGVARPYLQQILTDIGLTGQFPVLQLGMSYPADVELVETFSRSCRLMIVIEERRSFLEKTIRDTLFAQLPGGRAGEIASRLFGKRFPDLKPEFADLRFELADPKADLPNMVPAGQDGNGIPSARGLNPSALALALFPMLQKIDEIPVEMRDRMASYVRGLRDTGKSPLPILVDNVVRRSPTFCPGCPHRDSAGVMLQMRKNLADPAYMQKHYGRLPIDLLAHGDTGCYTMLMFPPTDALMHNYSGMGLGGGTGSGIDAFITNKQIVFMGDSTFFHSGELAISNAVKAGQDITFIILENGTTAMTGHQGHAGTETDLLGNKSYMQDIEKILRGLAASVPMIIHKMRPDDRDRYYQIVEHTILKDGVKVIIADKECGITHHRTELKQQRKQIREFGFLPRQQFMNVATDVCENCLECVQQTGCPGLMQVQTDYGRKIDTDLTWCVSDGACERVRTTNELAADIKPCPSFERITLLKKRRRRYTLPNLSLDKLPDPEWLSAPTPEKPIWRIHMSGVGGMGIGWISAILVRAGHQEGYHVLFSDKKGLAIRNGGVFSQITFIKQGGSSPASSSSSSPLGEVGRGSASQKVVDVPVPSIQTTAAIPFGQADVLMGIDALEAARAVDPRDVFRIATKDRTAAVVNTYKQATIETLLGRADFDPEALREGILKSCRAEWSYANDLSTLCERRLGSKQFVNIIMLGVAFQLGLIPVSAHSIAWAIKDSVKREHRKNLKAFNIGRKLALEPRALPPRPEPVTWEQLVTSKLRMMRRDGYYSRRRATEFERLAHIAVRHMKNLPDQAKYDLVLRVYDLLNYQDMAFAMRYIDLLHSIYRRDSFDCRYAGTIQAIWNLAKVMLIKDEPYVAYLLTRPEKLQRDIEKYNADIANGDRLIYQHYTSPEIKLGSWRFRPELKTRDWQLRLVRHAKFLRRLPGWHRHESEFRDWYIALLPGLDFTTPKLYDRSLAILRAPEEVTGYREIRYPKMAAAREKVEQLLANPPAPGVLATIREPISTPVHS